MAMIVRRDECMWENGVRWLRGDTLQGLMACNDGTAGVKTVEAELASAAF